MLAHLVPSPKIWENVPEPMTTHEPRRCLYWVAFKELELSYHILGIYEIMRFPYYSKFNEVP